jgi:predicted kinase
MIDVVMTCGVPGCGKTTFAQEWLKKDPTNRSRANRDDIRALIGHSSQHNGAVEFEKLVTEVQDKTIWAGMKAGRSVIVDNTHLQMKYYLNMEILLQDFANQFNVPVRLLVEVLDVDYNTCLARNNARDRVVPEDVVSRMYDKFKKIKPLIKKYEKPQIIHPLQKGRLYTPGKPTAIICDIDGTVGDLSHRDPYDFSKVLDDDVHEDIVCILNTLAQHFDATIIFVSGRDISCMPDTKLWLEASGIPWDELYMRPEGDTRADRFVKHDIFMKHIADRFNVQFVLDDRDQAVRTWRNLGLRCLQVEYGDF